MQGKSLYVWITEEQNEWLRKQTFENKTTKTNIIKNLIDKARK